ncbi:C-type lectin domain-containing protein, partial [Myxococcota bacterium]
NIKNDPNFDRVETGDTWNSVTYAPTTYQTKLTTLTRTFGIDEFKGMAIRPDIQSQPWYIVVGNDASSVYLWGNLETAIQPGMGYEIVDLKPPDRSAVVDAGDACSAPDVDFFNRGRLDNPNSNNLGFGPPWVDMGAIERPIGNSSLPQDLLTNCCNAGQVYGTHTYHYCPDQVGWGTAVFRCAQYGSYLVTMQDSTENTFVHGLQGSDNIWIGANDILEEGFFEWVSGEAWTFQTWNTGQPDNSNNEDCAEMINVSGRWQDTDCESTKAFVCEKPN